MDNSRPKTQDKTRQPQVRSDQVSQAKRASEAEPPKAVLGITAVQGNLYAIKHA